MNLEVCLAIPIDSKALIELFLLCLILLRVGPSCGAIMDRPPVLKIGRRSPWRERPFLSVTGACDTFVTEKVTH